MTEEQMKAEFEAFLAMQMPAFSPELLFERRENGEYVSLVAYYSWKAWQAGIASQAKNVPNLEDCHYENPDMGESEYPDAGFGVAVMVDGKVVAWFADWDETASEWCTENHFGRWLTWRAITPEIIPATQNEIENARQCADELAELFESGPEVKE